MTLCEQDAHRHANTRPTFCVLRVLLLLPPLFSPDHLQFSFIHSESEDLFSRWTLHATPLQPTDRRACARSPTAALYLSTAYPLAQLSVSGAGEYTTLLPLLPPVCPP